MLPARSALVLAACASLAVACVRPKRDPPERLVRRHMAQAFGVPADEVEVACVRDPAVFHAACMHHCVTEARGAVRRYDCDCPISEGGGVWPFDNPRVEPWHRAIPCSCVLVRGAGEE